MSEELRDIVKLAIGKGSTQQEVADAIGISRGYLSDILNGRKITPKMEIKITEWAKENSLISTHRFTPEARRDFLKNGTHHVAETMRNVANILDSDDYPVDLKCSEFKAWVERVHAKLPSFIALIKQGNNIVEVD